MKAKFNRLSEQYLAALSKHLEAGPNASSRSAIRLGRRAAALGLETLDLARIHERARTTLVSSGGSSRTKEGRMKRATTFFTEAITPIEKGHRAARKAEVHLKQLNQRLRQRTMESSAAARRLKQGTAQRQEAEHALQKSGKLRTKLLEKSRRLQWHLRHLTRQILSAQEDERQKNSHQLQDEIAQILVGINVRLLTLQKAAKASTGTFQKEIASTQRLVGESMRTINRFAHECSLHHET